VDAKKPPTNFWRHLLLFPGNAEVNKLTKQMNDAPINVIPGLAKKNKNTLTRRDPTKNKRNGKGRNRSLKIIAPTYNIKHIDPCEAN
jgi:hypothetical protein